MELGRLGVWTWIDNLSGGEAADFAGRLEEWGYSALWLQEAIGRDPFVVLSYLASQTRSLILATGIANIYARDPMAMRAIAKSLGDLSEGRFLLGIGVSHPHLVERVRGHTYGKPVTTMRNYLESMSQAMFRAREPKEEAPVVLAALRENMLRLAAEKADGAHPYLVPPEHTAKAREILGKGPLLIPHQKVMLETDASKARDVSRVNLYQYLRAPNYQRNLKWLGFEDSDFENKGSDRLVDALVAWGNEKTIRERIQAHYDAGADHVCIEPLRADGAPGPCEKLLEALRPA